jgi:hypothetical protein
MDGGTLRKGVDHDCRKSRWTKMLNESIIPASPQIYQMQPDAVLFQSMGPQWQFSHNQSIEFICSKLPATGPITRKKL